MTLVDVPGVGQCRRVEAVSWCQGCVLHCHTLPQELCKLADCAPNGATGTQYILVREEIVGERITFLDLECQNHPYFGALASPRHPDNYVVAVGYAHDKAPYDGAVEGVYYHNKDEAVDWLTIPEDTWLLVCHNAAFEINWFLTQQRDKFLAFLARGGRVFCTQLGHYLLSRQQELYPALDDIAPQYGGSHKIDEVVLHWQQGKLTSEIDKDLLLEYLLGPEGDIVNTRLCFYGQYQQLVARGMWDMALARCEALVFNAFAMHNGLKVDRELAFCQLAEQEEKLQSIETTFQVVRSEYFPPEVEFKASSRFHWSAWLFGGPIKYRARVPREDAQGNPIYVKGECVVLDNDTVAFVGVDIELDEVNNGDEWYDETFGALPIRYKSGKNKGLVKIGKEDTDEVDTKWGELTWDCPPLIDLKALSQDFQQEFTKEYTGKQTLADGSPVYSTSEDAVKAVLAQKIPDRSKEILTGLLSWVTLNKDIGAFYLREEYDDEGNVTKQSGALQFLTDRDFIYHSLNACATVTGRLSSTKPNMQQLPKKSDVKQMYVSRFGDDGSIMEADYCFAAGTPILGADFRYHPVESLRVGQELVGFDEHSPGQSAARKFRRAVVEAVHEIVRPAVRITLANGDTFECSTEHQWLATWAGSGTLKWRAAQDLHVGDTLSQVVDYWETASGEAAGYVRGMLDGEGWITRTRWGIGQKFADDNVLVEPELYAAFAACGDTLRQEQQRNDMVRYYGEQGPRNAWKTIGKYRPARLLAKLYRLWEGTSVRGKLNRRVPITKIEHIGERRVWAVRTSTRTMIARGYLTHNCALEVVVLADFSGDAALQEALREGKDMHLVRVAAKTGRDYDELVAIYADEEHPEHGWVAQERDSIKAPSFAYQYGATARGIAFATGYPVEEAQAFIDREKALFPGVEAFAEDVAQEVDSQTTTHREMDEVGAFRVFRKGFWKSPGGTEYEFREYPFNYWEGGERYTGMDFKPTQMRNYPIQGEASFFVQNACGWVMRWLVEENFYDGKVAIINTVHDAIYLDVHNSVRQEVGATLKEIMESIPEGLGDLGYDLQMPYPVDVTAGPSMADQHHFLTTDGE